MKEKDCTDISAILRVYYKHPASFGAGYSLN